MRRCTLSVLVIAAVVAALVSAAPASASQSATVASTRLAVPSPAGARLNVDLRIQRFALQGRQVRASGVVTATLSGAGGTPTTVRQRVVLQAQQGASCQILELTLDQLNLVLLGVTVHLDRVELAVTGRRRGGVLGRLFCDLAGARVRTGRAAAVASLNHSLRERPMHPLRFSVPTARAAQAAPTCSILDLVLGPLHLDLLGLVVDLNRVHLTITANPAGGVLGRLLCGVANTPLPTP
jgi:hypothetical protein